MSSVSLESINILPERRRIQPTMLERRTLKMTQHPKDLASLRPYSTTNQIWVEVVDTEIIPMPHFALKV
jgi:hypothetical protein